MARLALQNGFFKVWLRCPMAPQKRGPQQGFPPGARSAMGASRVPRDLDISSLGGIASPAVFDPAFGPERSLRSEPQGRGQAKGRLRPQGSPTPFLQARKSCQKRVADSSAVGHQTLLKQGLKIQEGSGDWPPGGYRGCHGWLGWLSSSMQHLEKIEKYVQSRLQLTHRFSRRA